MAISAQHIAKWEGRRVSGYEFLLELRFTVDGQPVDIRSWQVGLVARSDRNKAWSKTLATTVIGDNFDTLQVLASSPEAAGLTYTGLDTGQTNNFRINLHRAGEAGNELLGRILMHVDPAPENREYDEDGTIQPEVFVADLYTGPDEIDEELDAPGVRTWGMVRYYTVATEDEAIALASGARKFIEVTDDEIVYLFTPARGLQEIFRGEGTTGLIRYNSFQEFEAVAFGPINKGGYVVDEEGYCHIYYYFPGTLGNIIVEAVTIQAGGGPRTPKGPTLSELVEMSYVGYKVKTYAEALALATGPQRKKIQVEIDEDDENRVNNKYDYHGVEGELDITL